MKIISWNINGYRSVSGQNPSRKYDKITKENKLFEYIEKESPDILCMQEIKADVEQIKPELLCPEGYHSFYNPAKSKKGYSGVAVFSREKPRSVKMGLGIDRFDIEGRILELDFEDFIIFNIYFPKGYADSDRLEYKLDFYDALFEYTEKLKKQGKKLIISGDYNTAHKEIDLARPKQNVGTSGFMPVERLKLDRLADNGYIDTFRAVVSEGGHYTWWSQRGRARENNVGWRIDYVFVTKGLRRK
ncbi:MAG: exodeoxyribonuclease III, partial [Bacteroidota bacterium]